eukprot:5495209-Amphidinium_carterae.1
MPTRRGSALSKKNVKILPTTHFSQGVGASHAHPQGPPEGLSHLLVCASHKLACKRTAKWSS